MLHEHPTETFKKNEWCINNAIVLMLWEHSWRADNGRSINVTAQSSDNLSCSTQCYCVRESTCLHLAILYVTYLHLHVFLDLPCDLTQFSDSQKKGFSLEKALLSRCAKSFVILLSMYYLAGLNVFHSCNIMTKPHIVLLNY